MTSEEKKIFAGGLYQPSDPELKALKQKAHNLNLDYNRLFEDQVEEREEIWGGGGRRGGGRRREL